MDQIVLWAGVPGWWLYGCNEAPVDMGTIRLEVMHMQEGKGGWCLGGGCCREEYWEPVSPAAPGRVVPYLRVQSGVERPLKFYSKVQGG